LILAVDFQGGIENAWSSVATFLPKLAAALVILVIGYFVAKIISRILDRVLERMGFDRMIERGGLRQALARRVEVATPVRRATAPIGMVAGVPW
jgi:small-conductance mechanosensitive channel